MNQKKDNKRIALMSFHNAYNYGAALQAYALQVAVDNMGCEAEYINYINSHRKNLYDMKFRLLTAIKNKDVKAGVRALVGMPFMKIRGGNFKSFYSSYLKQTTQVYKNSDEARTTNNLYDKYIIGSDQVWNYVNNGTDWAYLLDFVEDASKKIAYSSSFGLASIPEEYISAYAKNIEQFYRIAVREKKGVELVEQLTGRKAHLVLDPVFLISSSAWKKLLNKKPADNYIFTYTDSFVEVQDFKDHCNKSHNCKFHVLTASVSPFDLLNTKNKYRVSMSPEQFLTEIYYADYIVTDSFHCLAFALLFHKKFTVLLSGNRGKDERLLNLLNLTKLEDRIFDSNMGQIDMEKDINYCEIDTVFKPYINYSLKYLKNAIFDLDDPIEITQKWLQTNPYMCDDKRCTGCTACEEICPTSAICMKPDSEGFKFPFRDQSKCINCGLCHKVCQVYQSHPSSDFRQRYWAVKNIDEIRKESTSGGMFTAISDYILNQGGVVVAASLDETTFKVKHQSAKNFKERDRMRGTYYVQSDLGHCFQQIKELLKRKEKVMFIGTPCQVSGLKHYLEGKDELLYTCDIMCHGVPSPLVFEKFITFLKGKGKIENFQFRDKSLGWRGYTDSTVINGKKIKNKLWLQSFDCMFSHNLINRMSCSNCMYTNYNRVGDITIGDYWGIENNIPEFEDKLGVSLVLCNSEKGNEIMFSLPNLKCVELNKEQCIQNSLTHPNVANRNRNQVFHCLNKFGYEKLMTSFGECNVRGFIKNILRKMIIRN